MLMFYYILLLQISYYQSLWNAARECGAAWTDYNQQSPGQTLNYDSDFADVHHLNVKGSMTFSRWLAEDLLAAYDLPDRRGDPAYASYDACADAWYANLAGFVSRPRD